MFSGIRLPRGLRVVLLLSFAMQLITFGLGYWVLSRTQENVDALSEVAITQVDAVAQSTQHLMDARIALSRAGTRMVLFGAAPLPMVKRARDEIDAANRSFALFLDSLHKRGKDNHPEGRMQAQALTDAFVRYRDALTQLTHYLESGNLRGFLDQPTQDLQDVFLEEQRQFLKYGGGVSSVSLHAMDERFGYYRIAAAVIMAGLLAATAAAIVEIRRREQRRLLSIALNYTDNAVVVTSPDGRTVYINEGFTRMLGYELPELIGKRPSDVVVGRFSDSNTVSEIMASVEAHESFQTEILVYDKGGRPLWISAVVNPVLDAQGVCQNLVGVWTDITSTKIHEVLQNKVLDAMAREEPLPDIMKLVCLEAEQIAPAVIASIRRFDDDGRLWTLAAPSLPKAYLDAIDGLFVGPDFEACAKLNDEFRHIVFSAHAEDPNYARYSQLAIESNLASCWWHPIRSIDGRNLGTLGFYYRDTRQPDALHRLLVDASLNLCALALEREGSREHIHRLAFYDGLTRLPNRRLLMSQAESMLAAAASARHAFSVLFIDLDHFKQVNDSLGHAAGDILLHEVAQRLQASLRATDIAGRLSGDEFVIMLSPCDTEQALAFAAQMMTALCEPVQIADVSLTPGASLGIATYPQHGEDINTLLLHADEAMYEAKSAGRHAYRLFDPQMTRAPEDRLKLGMALRDSLAARQLRLHYQPQVRLSDGSLYGVEALARWFHPHFGSVAPDTFIPLAEEYGLIAEFNRWVLTEACRQLAQWRDAGIDVPRLSVNISPTVFRDSAFASLIGRTLATHGLTPSQLTLEVTEGALLDATACVMATILEVHRLGVSLSIDDFGTGYSSLSYLHRLPVSEVKLDKSFIAGLESDANARTLASAVAGMCSSLHLTIVAEGVETDAQRQVLETQGYHVAQGYFFSRPLEAEAFETWTKTRRHGSCTDRVQAAA